jgi:anti-sigma B factor antagonist
MTVSLCVTVSPLLDHAVVTVIGDVQLGTSQTLTSHLDRAFGLTHTAVIVDMTEVGFCDSSGLNVFATALRRARAQGVVLLAYGLTVRVKRVFTITGLNREIHLHPDLHSAVSWLETKSPPPEQPAATA